MSLLLPLVAACNGGDPGEEDFVPETAGASQALACGTSLHGTMGDGSGFSCAGAYTTARIEARVKANAICPQGFCNVVETRGDCREIDDREFWAVYTMQFNCYTP
ncbi:MULTISPECIES: hypothetical protein [unclassified Myxococcus]|jgi:hypothetical protein|uniref:hypothetical protein n=1 Tax=Myxococcus TaxID=32 RepID=UPI001CBC5C6C|nr:MULTISPECIES: hypothetical protein [unclassified Myxococcus]MBZ4396373.1 hypothetical protein [Myxococcus sp. AS-1-15]BDT37883.1 hypothetical protein MFMH1_75520 [Myxococcus sp. MH1]